VGALSENIYVLVIAPQLAFFFASWGAGYFAARHFGQRTKHAITIVSLTLVAMLAAAFPFLPATDPLEYLIPLVVCFVGPRFGARRGHPRANDPATNIQQG